MQSLSRKKEILKEAEFLPQYSSWWDNQFWTQNYGVKVFSEKPKNEFNLNKKTFFEFSKFALQNKTWWENSAINCENITLSQGPMNRWMLWWTMFFK